MSASGLGRKFHFIREIASGGFGSVYLAKVIHGDGFARICAIKLLHPKWSENVEIASRMRDEARLLGWLRHKNLVEVLDLTRINGRVAVIMEYLEAVDVKAIIADALERAEAIPVRVCIEICASVASALDAAYNRPPYAGEKPLHVIHRDIKPSNIMLDTSGSVKVLDFGVARADFAERESKTQELSFGSIEYMPPERLFFEPDTPQGDVYSLGATLYELLSLEKFGKAKLRAEQMETYFDQRWNALRERRAFPGPEVEGEVHLLLRDMMSFDTDSRLMAADCVNRMRVIARRCNEESLIEWAEAVVPPVFQVQSTQATEESSDSLAGQTLAEDARGFGKDDETSDITAPAPPEFLKPDPDDDDESLDESGRLADEQWKKVKEQTLNDIEKKPIPAPVVAAPPVAAPPPVVAAPPPPIAAPPPPIAAPPPPIAAPPPPIAAPPIAASLPIVASPPPPAAPPPAPPAPKPVMVAKAASETTDRATDPGAEERTEAPPKKEPPVAKKESPPPPKSPGSDIPPPIRGSIKSIPVTHEEDVEDPPTVAVIAPKKPDGTKKKKKAEAAAPPAEPAKPPVVQSPLAPPIPAPQAAEPPKVSETAPDPAPPKKAPPAPTAVFKPSDIEPEPDASAKPKKKKKQPPPLPKDDATEEVSEEGGRSWGLIIGVLMFLVVVVGGIALFGVLGLGVGGAAIVASQTPSAPSAPVDVPPVVVPDPPKPPAPKIEGPVAKFISAAPGTKKVTVKCDKGSGEGPTEAEVAAEGAGKCTVTAVDDKRKRFSAVVKDVTAREYTCFTDGGKECK